MAEEVRVNPQEDERDEEVQGQIGLLSDFNPGTPVNPDVTEIEVDPVTPTVSAKGERQAIVRVNRPIEEMSFVEGVPGQPGRSNRQLYSFEEGHQYQVPVPVARELEAIGALYH